MDIQKHIKVVKDFPKKGIIFKDISPIFLNPQAFAQLIGELADAVRGFGVTLGLGLATSLFAAIFVNKLILMAWMTVKKPTKINL